MNCLELIGTLLGLIYLFLEYKANPWLWVASIAMPAIYLKVYYDAGLYADLGISIYYVIASVYGLVVWIKGSKQKDLPISLTPGRVWLKMTLVAALLMIGIGIILSRFTDSTVPWADAFTTALSIVAMWMLAKKYLEQWLVWIVADVACSLLYLYKELWFTAGLYFLYAVIAVAGYYKWKKLYKKVDYE